MDTGRRRSRAFDRVAQLYDGARPSYPMQLFGDLVALAELATTAQILEVGAGTGKATLPLAQQGYRIHCLEPGSQMAAIAAENLRPYPNVSIETATFEDWPVQAGAYDLVMSAQALKPAGNVALIWNLAVESEVAIAQQLDQIYRTYADWQLKPMVERLREKEQALVASQYFDQPVVKQYAWSLRYTTQQYLDLVGTQSDYLIQSEDVQRELLGAIAAAIEGNGGAIIRPYISVLLLAKKAVT